MAWGHFYHQRLKKITHRIYEEDGVRAPNADELQEATVNAKAGLDTWYGADEYAGYLKELLKPVHKEWTVADLTGNPQREAA